MLKQSKVAQPWPWNKTSPLLEKTETQDTNRNVNGVLLMTSRLPKHLTAAVRIRHQISALLKFTTSMPLKKASPHSV